MSTADRASGRTRFFFSSVTISHDLFKREQRRDFLRPLRPEAEADDFSRARSRSREVKITSSQLSRLTLELSATDRIESLLTEGKKEGRDCEARYNR